MSTILLGIAAGGMLLFSLVLIVVSVVSIIRTSSMRMVPVAIAFFLLLVKGILIALAALEVEGDWLLFSVFLDLPMIGLLAYSLLGP